VIRPVQKAAIFDLDGTLLDRESSLEKFIVTQYQRLKLLPGAADQKAYTRRFIELDARGSVWKDKVYQSIVAEFGITALTWQELLEDYILHFSSCCIEFPGMKKGLARLEKQGFALGIITNGRSPFQEKNIQALGIEDYFSTILVSEKEGIKKPEAAIFQRAAANLGVPVQGAVYVGDHPEADIADAKKAGMKAIWKKNDNWPAPASPDAVFENFEELPGIIENLFPGVPY
jgi:putative hydrolase of the HAD superfamily